MKEITASKIGILTEEGENIALICVSMSIFHRLRSDILVEGNEESPERKGKIGK